MRCARGDIADLAYRPLDELMSTIRTASMRASRGKGERMVATSLRQGNGQRLAITALARHGRPGARL
jgi:hypothetical protein